MLLEQILKWPTGEQGEQMVAVLINLIQENYQENSDWLAYVEIAGLPGLLRLAASKIHQAQLMAAYQMHIYASKYAFLHPYRCLFLSFFLFK